MERHVVYCGTRNIYQDMETAAKSLLGNTKIDKVHFLIEDDEFPSPLPDIIQCYNVSNQTFFPADGPNFLNQFTYMALMRIALPYILDDDISVVLSLDHDALVIKDIGDIWNIPIEDYYFAGVHECSKTIEGVLYCNFGVILYNLDKLRNGKAKECIDVLNKRWYRLPEQDVCNYLCQGYIYDIPSKYNTNIFTLPLLENEAPCIKHYAGFNREDWYNELYITFWREKTWDEVMKIQRYCL